MQGSEAQPGHMPTPDQRLAMKGLLILDLAVRLFVWTKAIALTCWLFTVLHAWPAGSLVGAGFGTAWLWGRRLGLWVLLFNLIYVAEIVLLRLLIPTPREGRHPFGPGLRVSRHLIWASLIGTLIKARFEAPFPGFLVYHLSVLPPLKWLIGPIFGPKSRSVNFTDPGVLDPHFVSIGRNVVIGLDALISAHHQDRESITFKRVIIEDDVVIGGRAVILAGAHLKRGCMIGVNAVVLPDSVVGPDEFWAGVPARLIRRIGPADDRAAEVSGGGEVCAAVVEGKKAGAGPAADGGTS